MHGACSVRQWWKKLNLSIKNIAVHKKNAHKWKNHFKGDRGMAQDMKKERTRCHYRAKAISIPCKIEGKQKKQLCNDPLVFPFSCFEPSLYPHWKKSTCITMRSTMCIVHLVYAMLSFLNVLCVCCHYVCISLLLQYVIVKYLRASVTWAWRTFPKPNNFR